MALGGSDGDVGVARTVSLADDDDDEKDLGGVEGGGVRRAPKEKTMPPSGALLTILHRSGIIGVFSSLCDISLLLVL